MAHGSSPDYRALFYQEVELRARAEERGRQEAEQRKQAEERGRQERARTRLTTLDEFIKTCHDLLSYPLEAGKPSRSTKGAIQPPTGKYCPTTLQPWPDCPAQQQVIYDAVRKYLQPTDKDELRLFSYIMVLEDLGRQLCDRPLRSERDLESYARFAIENKVHDVVYQLCKIPEAREQFQLGHGLMFDNHANVLHADEDKQSETEIVDESNSQNCIHRVDGTKYTLLTTVEYKPPHKLSVATLRAGLRPMNFLEEVVRRTTIPTDKGEKLQYNAERLTGAVLAQEYHVMIQEGLEYSYITNGLALVLLRIRREEPGTLYYHLCEPKTDVDANGSWGRPNTAVARVLCLCLMSFGSPIRGHDWRNDARSGSEIWRTSFDHARSQIPTEELRQSPPYSEYSSSESTGSEYLPSSPVPESRRIVTRSQANCVPMEPQSEHRDSSDSDSEPVVQGRKRGFSQVISSPPSQRSSARHTSRSPPSNGQYQHTAQFCTLRCLLGLQQKGLLDSQCPNVKFHKRGMPGDQHHIDAKQLVQMLKCQLDIDLDHNCTPFGECGSFGAPIKITCARFGYTVVGKGTTSRLWKTVSREAEAYRVLQAAQGSAVPVFLGSIDLRLIYFIHGAGDIQHMLLMGWGGECLRKIGKSSVMKHEASRSIREIRAFGIEHDDLRFENFLWSEELGRVLIIDFHGSRVTQKRIASWKSSSGASSSGAKRQRLTHRDGAARNCMMMRS